MIRKHYKQLNIKSIYIFLIAFFAFISMPPYFVWTYANIGVMLLIKVGLPAIICVLGVCYAKRKLKMIEVVLAACIILFGIIQTIKGDYNANGFIVNLMIYVVFAVFIFQDKETRASSFLIFYKMVALSMIPGIIVYIIQLFGIELPHDVILSTNELKTLANHYYLHYFGSVLYFDGVGLSFCGMFDEPGTVGTFAGLLLAANMVKIENENKGKLKLSFFDIVLLAAGILSSSKAFLVLLIILILYHYLNKKWLKAFVGCVVLLIFIIVLLNLNIQYAAISSIKEMINEFLETGILSLGRARGDFDIGWSAFLCESPIFLMFGHGLGTSQAVASFAGSAEIRMLIYEIGFVGVAFEVLWLLVTAHYFGKHINNRRINLCFLLIFVFFLSMYQRQNVLSANYIILLFGGCSYIAINATTKKYTNTEV